LDPLIELLEGLGSTTTPAASPLEVAAAISLTFALTAMIGAVYRHLHTGPGYSQDYVQNLILLGMVVTVVMLVVATNATTAFAVFAAFSIIRFRRAVPRAIDVGFIFFAMSVGLAVGARQYELAAISAFLICLAIGLASYFKLFAPEQPSHSLRIQATPDIDFEQAFAEAFAEYCDRVSLMSIESVQAGLMTELRYAVRLKRGASSHELMRALQLCNGNNRIILRSTSLDFDP
jgi:hypothetical protein